MFSTAAKLCNGKIIHQTRYIGKLYDNPFLVQICAKVNQPEYHYILSETRSRGNKECFKTCVVKITN